MIDRINKLLANPNLSAANKEALMGMQAQYRNLGGNSTPSIGSSFTQGLKGSATQAIDNKIRQALDLGVPKADIYRTMKNNALRARDQKIRSHLLSGGLKGLDAANQNQAGLITQAGLNNQSFTPGAGAAAPVGQAYEAAGQAEVDAAKQIQGIDKQEQDFKLAEEKKDKEKQTEAEAFQNLNTKSNDAIGYLNVGWKALLARQQANAKAARIFGAANLLPNANVAGIERREQQYIDEFIRKQVSAGKLDETSLSALNNLISVSTELTTTALKALGPGPKTDFDFIVAERSIANLEGTPKTIADQFDRIRKNAKKWLFKSNQSPVAENIEIKVPAGNQKLEWAEPEAPPGGWTGDALEPKDGEPNNKTSDPENKKDEPLSGEILLSQDVKGSQYDFVGVSSAEVPADVASYFKGNGSKKNEIILGDDSYIYIYWDASSFDTTFPQWIKSNVTYKGGQ